MFPKLLALVSVYSGIHAMSYKHQNIVVNNTRPFTGIFKNKPQSNIALDLIDHLGNVATLGGYGLFGAFIGSSIVATAPISLPLIYFYYNQHSKNDSHLIINKLLLNNN